MRRVNAVGGGLLWKALFRDVPLLSHPIKPGSRAWFILATALVRIVREPSMKTPRMLLVTMTLALTFGTFGGPALADPRARIVQSEVTIPTNAQIDRMEQQAITTPPLDVSEGALPGNQAAQIRQMDLRAHRIDEKLLNNDGVCNGC